MNIIKWSNLLCVSGFFPVNFGASIKNYSKFTKASQKHLWPLSVIRTCTPLYVEGEK